MTSIAFGAAPGSTAQIGLTTSASAHTPNWKSCGVGCEPAGLVGAEPVLPVQHHT